MAAGSPLRRAEVEACHDEANVETELSDLDPRNEAPFAAPETRFVMDLGIVAHDRFVFDARAVRLMTRYLHGAQTIKAFDQVKSFFEILASRLSESLGQQRQQMPCLRALSLHRLPLHGQRSYVVALIARNRPIFGFYLLLLECLNGGLLWFLNLG